MTGNAIVMGRRGTSWSSEQEWIDRELEWFSRQNRPDVADLPGDLGKLVLHIHENLFDVALNVSSAKRSCQMRNNNVTTRFRVVLGVGIHEYIEALRMDAAGWLLRECGVRVYLVAMAVGYAHLETFCRAFQRRFGCTPSQHREVDVYVLGFNVSREKIKNHSQEAMSNQI